MRPCATSLLLAVAFLIQSGPVVSSSSDGEGATTIDSKVFTNQYLTVVESMYDGIWHRFYPERWCGSASCTPDTRVILNVARNRIIENRLFIARKRESASPAWDGRAPSFILPRMIWYFDADSCVEKMNFTWWLNSKGDNFALLKEEADRSHRRTVCGFLCEDEGWEAMTRMGSFN